MRTGTSSAVDGQSSLISAVQAGDADLVRILLHEHSDFDYLDAAFRLAVRMHAGRIAQLLLQYGADSGQSRPDDLIPLSEAVDSGSPALFEALLDHEIRGRYPEVELLEARDLARRWHETGVEAELRRRTGSRDAVGRKRVQDGEYDSVVEFTLGGMTVRDGHGAILTYVEELLGLRTSFEELMDRALAQVDQQDHATWSRASLQLSGRREEATWTAAATLRTSPDPSRRLFGAEVLRLVHLFDDSDEDAFAGPALDLFTGWAAEETDVAVLNEVLVALGEHIDPRADAALLAHAGHPDAGVRRAVAQGLSALSSPSAFSGDARTALLGLMADPDAVVRETACRVVAEGRDHDPVFADAMAAVLDDTDRLVQLAAVYGLALHDDERCVAAARLLGPPQRGSLEEEGYLDAVCRYQWLRDGRRTSPPVPVSCSGAGNTAQLE
ncbi:HEAT repeat domain-containing protein [Streptomyces sp. wa22]|uniref:HEAT repeat domain-containing protein n=1 Tax=Streptomyces sp. wa22 TaxID=1828244 RepID=UPI001C9BFED8|nr:HEAT repeat domain-containing protein [Streptomyces sp. wa22]